MRELALVFGGANRAKPGWATVCVRQARSNAHVLGSHAPDQLFPSCVTGPREYARLSFARLCDMSPAAPDVRFCQLVWRAPGARARLHPPLEANFSGSRRR